jgi:hypothetical protein
MGCWQATSFLTRLPIHAGDRVTCFWLDGKNDFAHGYHMAEFPIFGEYDDYGGIMNCDVGRFGYKFLSENIDNFASYDEQYYGHTINREIERDDLCFCEEELFHKYSTPTEKERADFLLSAKFQNWLDFAFHGRRGLDVDRPEIEGWFDLADEVKAEHLGFKIKFRTPEEQSDYEKRKYQIDYKMPDGFYYDRQPLLFKYPIEEWGDDFLRNLKFHSFCHGVRRPIWNDNAGSQAENWLDHLSLLTDALAIANAKIRDFYYDMPEGCEDHYIP